MNSTSKSDSNFVRRPLNTVGIWGQRTAIDETYHRAVRHPETLMPMRGVRVSEFAVDLSVEVANNPEAAARAGSLFELVFDAVEQVVRDFHADVGSLNDEKTHDVSPLVGVSAAGTADDVEPIVGDAGGAEPLDAPPAPSDFGDQS